jgi:hypothetical protein
MPHKQNMPSVPMGFSRDMYAIQCQLHKDAEDGTQTCTPCQFALNTWPKPPRARYVTFKKSSHRMLHLGFSEQGQATRGEAARKAKGASHMHRNLGTWHRKENKP